jgi:glyoxylase-like metal-dependent hydrolase (beta-lactamase superfamily II)
MSAPIRVGDLEVTIVSGGAFKLDGGAMFGIIPRPLWIRAATPDERGRIPMETNCVLARGDGFLLLLDTGNGPKMGEKERDIFALAPGEALLDNLAAAGAAPEDVTHVLLSHLHMDHCGGASRLQGGEVVPAFPRARFLAQRREWDDAIHNRSHMTASYREENLRPLAESGRLELLDGDADVLPGVQVHVTGGHTPGHQCVFFRSAGETAFCPVDICPTTAHLRGPYNMAYDLEPYRTMQVKAELLGRAADEGWLVLFDHDPVTRVARLRREGGAIVVAG